MSARRPPKERLRAVALALLVAGAGLLAAGCYLPAKARLAQVLLRLAWAHTAPGGAPVRPWPWAETWPVARLLVPERGIDAIVLAGTQGAALAFAPGHLDGSGPPGEPGNAVLAGHRDTVFRFLGELRLGDELWIETTGRRRVRFEVTETRVVDRREIGALAPTTDPTLTLVTCYPLDAIAPGGPLRYVVRAVASTPDTGP